MKLITALRFSLIVFIIYRITLTLQNKSHLWEITEIIVNIVMDTLAVFYIFYLIREGISEWKSKPSTNSKAFKIYGLVFEIILFTGGFWVLVDTPWADVDFLRGSISILFVLGLLTLAITDSVKLKRYKL